MLDAVTHKNNIEHAYPNAVFVEYYVPGTKDLSGVDWSSVGLVFEKDNDRWYLVGLVHDQWAIYLATTILPCTRGL